MLEKDNVGVRTVYDKHVIPSVPDKEGRTAVIDPVEKLDQTSLAVIEAKEPVPAPAETSARSRKAK